MMRRCSLLFLAGTFSLQAGLFSTNLIVNGGAEDGPGSPNGNTVPEVPGWTTNGAFTVDLYNIGSGWLLSTDPGPPDRGTNYFAGGPNNAFSSAYQQIDVSAGSNAIDGGGITCTLSGWLGGYLNQDDNAVLTAYFGNSVSTNLGSLTIGPVFAADRNSATGLLYRSNAGNVPIGTRWILIALDMTRLAGQYNDGYADRLSLVLAGPSLQIHQARGQVTLQWTTNSSGFNLETATRLDSSAEWTNYPGNPVPNGTNFEVTVSPDQPQRFFRLHQP